MAMKRPSGSIFVTQSKKKLNINKKPAAATDAELTTRNKIDALNDKIAKYQNGTISEDNFSQDDKHKCWDRFHKQVQKMPEVSEQFKSLTGPGCQDKKNTILFGWLKDPTWGKCFAHATRTIFDALVH